MQEYRYALLFGIARFFELFGVRRPLRYEKPVQAGDYDHALHVDHPEAPSLLETYLEEPVEPHIGGQPNVTAAPPSNGIGEPDPFQAESTQAPTKPDAR
jgi:hypothetical protein